MNKLCFLVFGVLLFQTALVAQDQLDSEVKSFSAARIKDAITVDGELDEPIWSQLDVATDFIRNYPDPGKRAHNQTEVMIAYDDKAIYVGARCFVPRDSLLRELSVRDNGSNSDAFWVMIDGLMTKQSCFAFGISSAGVQGDFAVNSGSFDFNWNAVFWSNMKVHDDHWSLEFKIPYSQLRFSDKDIQKWGINFERQSRYNREQSHWSFIDPEKDGFANQFGVLEGIENIKPPVRLSFTPFAASYTRIDPAANGDSKPRQSFSGGMDLKYGITENFTLDMALIPDFGDARFDNVELNLGPFEQRFDENRPFFTEGVDLFERGNVFYSRRIGSSPTKRFDVYNEIRYDSLDNALDEIVDNPSAPQLLNAAKISGRTKDGLGVGFFNAVTANTYATIRDIESGEERKFRTEPLSNYNMIVIDKLLPNNGFMSFYNTFVWRDGAEFRDAFVTGAAWRMPGSKGKYAASGSAKISQLFLPEGETSGGYAYDVSYSKISGKLNWSIRRSEESPSYNPNDLGFLRSNNEINHNASVTYRLLKPFSIFNGANISAGAWYNQVHSPRQFYEAGFWTNFFFNTKNFFAFGGNVNFSPWWENNPFRARERGRIFRMTPFYSWNGWISSDYRKAIALDMSIGHNARKAWDRNEYWTSINPRWRVNNKLTIRPGAFISITDNTRDYVTTNGSEIIFGNLDFKTIESTLGVRYLFTPTMSFEIAGRHYWARAEYDQFFELDDDGNLGATTFTGNYDQNFNVFNIDAGFLWQFAPGSTMSVVYKNSIFEGSGVIENNYGRNLRNLFQQDQVNQLSIKFLYFLDYNSLRRKKKAAVVPSGDA